MTEEQWLTATDPTPMLEFIRDKGSDRQLRLLAIARCKRVWEHLADPKARNAVVLVERAADGMGLTKQLAKAEANLQDITRVLELRHGEFGYLWEYQWMAIRAVQGLIHQGSLFPVERIRYIHADILQFVRETSVSEYHESDELAEQSLLSCLLREIFGNPFRRVTFDPSWLTSTVRLLAEGIYSEKAFDRYPILADALMDADCDCDDILNHLRSNEPHVRGCWALDLILGKE